MSDTQQTAEDMRDGQKTVMLSKIEDMQTRFLGSDLARDPAYAAHRDMLHCIHYSTNGAPNKIEALAQSIASKKDLEAVVEKVEKQKEKKAK